MLATMDRLCLRFNRVEVRWKEVCLMLTLKFCQVFVRAGDDR